MRILLVDDHAVVRRGLREMLEDEFEQAVFGEAGDAAEALREVRRQEWDVVVLDITLPGRNGLSVLKDLKATHPRLPVLILSMHPEDQYALRAFQNGAHGYLTKETAPDELVQAVRKVLSGGRYVSPSLAEDLAFRLRTGLDSELHETLSDREYEVMRMLASGKSVSQIAEDLSLSVKTVSTYRSRVLDKMGMGTNAELTRYAVEKGMLDF